MTDFYQAAADPSAQSQHHELHNPHAQQFFGPIYCCVIVMPGAHLNQTYASPEASEPTPADAAPSTTPSKPSKRKRAPKREEAFEPTLDVFIRRKGLTDGHFALLLSALQRVGWIDEATAPDDFVALFSGEPCDCHVMWNRLVGKGILRDLFKMMLDGGFIKCPEGVQYLRLIESHFIYPDGQPVRGLKGGYASQKAQRVLQTCRKLLLIHPEAGNFRSMADQIREEFDDIRFDRFA